jgi:hypothetical protein
LLSLFKFHPELALQDDEQIDGGLGEPCRINHFLLLGNPNGFQSLSTKDPSHMASRRVVDVERFSLEQMENVRFLVCIIHKRTPCCLSSRRLDGGAIPCLVFYISMRKRRKWRETLPFHHSRDYRLSLEQQSSFLPDTLSMSASRILPLHKNRTDASAWSRIAN